MKKKFIHKKKVSWRKTLLVLQVIVLSPVLLSLIAINWLSDWLLTKWEPTAHGSCQSAINAWPEFVLPASLPCKTKKASRPSRANLLISK